MAELLDFLKLGKQRKKINSWSPRSRRSFLMALLFLSPWLIGFLLFTLYPMGMSLIYSLTEYHTRQPLVWNNFQNFANMFNDDLFWKSLWNTLYMVIFGVPVTLFASFVCAILLNLKVRGQSIYRVIYFLPSIVPAVASTLLWLWILNPQAGVMNTLLGYVGIPGPNWLNNPDWSKPSLIMLGLWGMGGTIVIYLSGLQDVSKHLLEAAELDGASWMQRLRFITIPLVSPITLFNLVTGMIGMFQYFTQAYIFRGTGGLGAPLSSTLFYSVYLFQQGFQYLDFGFASAMAWVLFLIILVCTILVLKISDKYTFYAG